MIKYLTKSVERAVCFDEDTFVDIVTGVIYSECQRNLFEDSHVYNHTYLYRETDRQVYRLKCLY